jgi:Protein of unknown function (DUF1036)
MGLYFKNKTSEFVWVAYGYYAPGCAGGVNWAKKGWWQIPPGMTVKVRSGWVGGQKWFFYAEANDFSPVWSGPYFTFLPWAAFDWCWVTSAGSGRTLGMRKVYVDPWYMDYTIGLVA